MGFLCNDLIMRLCEIATILFHFQVFIRELISNSSDALEKLRLQQMTGSEIADSEVPLEIHIAVDDKKKTFTIQVYTVVFV